MDAAGDPCPRAPGEGPGAQSGRLLRVPCPCPPATKQQKSLLTPNLQEGPTRRPSSHSPWSWRLLYRSLALVGCARAVLSHFGCSYLQGAGGRREAGPRPGSGCPLPFLTRPRSCRAHVVAFSSHITAPVTVVFCGLRGPVRPVPSAPACQPVGGHRLQRAQSPHPGAEATGPFSDHGTGCLICHQV